MAARRTRCGSEALEPRMMLAGESLVISELMADNANNLQDADGAHSDWIEVYNPGTDTVDLTGWHLTDDEDELDKWTFPARSLDSGERLLVFASSKDRLGVELHANFALGRGGEYLALVQPDGATVEFAYAPEFPPQFEDVSYGLSADLATQGFFTTPTPGTANTLPPVDDPTRQLLITEIMYHPASENDLEEFIELYNEGTQAVNLEGWRIANGVDYVFPNVTLGVGQYLAVASDVATFTAKYPGVTNVVGGWTGRLSNGGEEIVVEDNIGRTVDRVQYADQGDWARRDVGPPDLGYTGWVWIAEHDGEGRSAEMINLEASNNQGQNWAPSLTPEGTPGAANSAAAADIAPVITDVEHFPLIPGSTDVVTIVADVSDEAGAPDSVTLWYRVDGDPTFTSAAMLDDGNSGDGNAGDGTYAAAIPAQPQGTVVEFYVGAEDAGGASRTVPGPIASTGLQQANRLYRVDNALDAAAPWTPGSQPIYYLIMSESERADLEEIGDGGPESDSDAQMNGTFISIDGTGAKVRYNVGIRNRGHGSRNDPPNNYRVNIPHDVPWNNFTALNLNSKYTFSQVIGSAIQRVAGNATPDATAVQVRVNGANLAEPAGRMFGTYAHIEPLDGDTIDKHFPADAGGNLYKALRTDGGGDEADLSYEGTNPNSYRDTYFKQTNDEIDDWSDLINLTDVLNNAPAATYFEDVSAVVDIEQWTRYLALDTLMMNWETGLNRGIGDDFAFYRGVDDPRFKLVPHDLDTLLGEGNASGPINHSIFNFTNVEGLDRFLNHPRIARIFYGQILDLIGTTYNPAVLNPLLDQVLGPWVARGTVDDMKQFVVNRSAAVLAQVPRQLTAASGLAVQDGFFRSTDGTTVSLSGQSHAALTGSATVNGQLAQWNGRTATWSQGQLNLRPGINRIVVQAFTGEAGTGTEFDRTLIDVWYDTGSNYVTLSGTLSEDTVLTAAAGPYLVDADLVVPAGVRLTIEPGTTIYFEEGTELTVRGVIDARGTAYDRIRLTGVPGAPLVDDIRPELPQGPPKWGGVQLVDTMSPENILAFVDVDYAQTSDGSIGVEDSEAIIDNVSFSGTHLRMIRTSRSSVIIRNSIFPDMFAADEFPRSFTPPLDNVSEHVTATGNVPAGGHYIIENNIFGRNKGHNDVIDLTGNVYPNPIAQVRNNIFLGGGDEALDGGGDILFEGNVFMNFNKDLDNDGSGDSNAISTSDGATSVMMIVRNTFINVDHAVNFKTGAYGYFENNTVIDVTAPHLSLATDPPSRMLDFSAINFLIPNDTNPATGRPRDVPPGLGALTSGNVFTGIPQTVFGHVDFVNPFIDPPVNQVLEVHDSLVPSADAFAGADAVNGRQFDFVEGEARIVDPAGGDYRLGLGSAGIGSGPNGLDMGSQVPEGASISGEPTAVTARTDVTLTFGGPGVLSFEYRVNDGPWQPEIQILDPRDDLTDPQKIRTVDVQLTGLADGEYTVYARGRNFAGQVQAVPTASRTWTVDTSLSRLMINEVLAINNEAVDLDGTRPDVIELYNDGHPSTPPLDLSGMSITDDPAVPAKFVFPAGTTIAPGEFLLLYADESALTPGIHLGFSLDGEGEGVYLYESAAAGGALVDSIEFGLQLPDYSYGRAGHLQQWSLNQPTLGGPNVAQQTGDPARLFINEWLATEQVLFDEDFIELYNSDPLPVPLDGLYLTDDPITRPDKYPLPPVSFIAGGGYRVFVADENSSDGPLHLNFKLSPQQELIALLDAGLNEIDKVLYYGQTTDVSQGRVPDGGGRYEFFVLPTPGVRNSSRTSTSETETVTLLAWNDDWSYEDSGTDPGTGWSQVGFDDSTWDSGPGPLGVEGSTLPEPLRTTLTLHQQPYYFRAHFTLDADPAEITSLQLRTQIDDGAVFYINGQETPNRVGMGGGVVTFNTFANRTVGNARLEGPFTIPASMLTSGDNLFAVESHQHSGGNSSDIVMGVELTAEIVTTVTEEGEDLINLLALLDHLRITEVMYHPVEGNQLEFVELRNTGQQPLDLEGVRIRGGVDFTFPAMTLQSGQYVVVAGDVAALEAVYGTDILVAGQFSGNLNNGGEDLRLLLPNPYDAAALRFEYRDSWEPSTDGGGYSLVAVDQFAHPADWQQRVGWTAGLQIGGTPGRGDFDPAPPAAPTGLSASDDGVSQIVLAWDEVVEPVSPVVRYNVYRDGQLVGTSLITSFIDALAVPDQTYLYQVSATNDGLVEGARSAPRSHRLQSVLEGATLDLVTRDSYLPGSPLLVRVELLDDEGNLLREVWDAIATISTDVPGVTLSTDLVTLYNGVGSVLVTATGGGDFTLTASLATLSDQQDLVTLESVPIVEYSGTLPGASTTWSGIVHVTGNLLVPAGHTLTIDPGTLVLIDGVDPGDTDGVDIDVEGNVQSLGVAARPVTITAFDPALPWGEIHHQAAGASLYQYTNISRGGSSPGIGHTGTGPILRVIDSTVDFDHGAVTDVSGKVMWADGAELTMRHMHLARATMGPEIGDTALLMEDTWITEMFGPNDNDGIYLRDQQTGQDIILRRGVVADGDDDGIDTLGSIVTIEDYIIRDFFDKGISINGGQTTVLGTLIVYNDIGIETKSGGDTIIDRSTLVENVTSLRREDAGGSTTLTNSIVIGTTDSVVTTDDPDDYDIQYTLLGDVWPGTGNLVDDPLFVSVVNHNFRLLPGSPAIDAGDPASPLDADDTRADMGAYPFNHGPPAQFTIKHTPHVQLGNAPLGSPTDQVEILWQTETTGAGDSDAFQVQYRRAGDALWTTAADPTTIDTGVGTRLNHFVVIAGLDYDTDYEYRVRHLRGGQVVDSYQDTVHTRLAPGDVSTFTFVAYGDSASGNPPTGLIGVQSRINSLDPAFALLLGDNAYGATTPEWGSHESHDLRFDPAINPLTPAFISGHVEYPAIGNAELNAAGGQATRDNYSTPLGGPLDTAGSGTYFADRAEHNYSFDYGDVHFVTFDGNSFHGNPSDPARLAEQLAWAVADLNASTAQWKVVYTHFPAIAPQAGFDAGSAYYQQVVAALLGANVDLLFVGHSHSYQRSYPLTGQTGGVADFVLDTDNDYAQGAGLVQVISGVGGRSIIAGDISGTPYLAAAFTADTQPAARDGFVQIDVSADRLTLSYVAADNGAVLDQFTISTPDSTPPVVTVNVLSTPDTTPQLTGTVDDPLATIEVTVSGNTFTAANNGNGTWTLADNTITPPLGAGVYDVLVTATDPANNVGTDATADELTVTASGQVVSRLVFYNNSRFDFFTPGAGAADDAAIATDKVALLPSQTAGPANYTSYDRGINGVFVDLADLPSSAPITAADFEFRVGNTADPATWSPAPPPAQLVVRPGSGAGGSDRVVIIWADGAIRNAWLQVTVKANATTGLATADVFYFGSAVGDTLLGNLANVVLVDAADRAAVRDNPRDLTNPAAVDSPFDFNRDGLVNAVDRAIVLANPAGPFTGLLLLTAPGGPPPSPADSPAPAEIVAGTTLSTEEVPLGRSRLPSGTSTSTLILPTEVPPGRRDLPAVVEVYRQSGTSPLRRLQAAGVDAALADPFDLAETLTWSSHRFSPRRR